MVGGFKPGFEVGKKDSKNTELTTTGFDLSLEMGIGLDVYYELFKFSPELRFSVGMVNLHNQEPNYLSSSIQRASTYSVSLFFFFE